MENKYKNSYNNFDASKLFFQTVLIPQIIVFAIVMLITNFVTDFEALNSNIFYIIFSLTITQIIFFGIIFIYNKRNKVNVFKACRINKKINIMQIIFAVLISFVALYAFAPLVNLLDFVMQKIGFNMDSSFALPFDNFWNFLLMTVCYAVIPAIVEEILFRGMIFNGLRQKGVKYAIIMSALIFMLMHASIQQTIYQFALGIILASVFYITGNLVISIIMHFFNNFFVVLISYITYGQASEPIVFSTALDYISPFIYVIIGCFVIYGLLTYLKKFTKDSCPDYVSEEPSAIILNNLTLQTINTQTMQPTINASTIDVQNENIIVENANMDIVEPKISQAVDGQIAENADTINADSQNSSVEQSDTQTQTFAENRKEFAKKYFSKLSKIYFYTALALSILIFISDIILSL